MAADSIFFPRDRAECRRTLGLPAEGILIGYAGSLHSSRDMQILLALMNRCVSLLPDARFILSGRRLQHLALPANAVHLGYLRDEEVPLLINAMNLMLSLNHLSAFGEHSYPVKIYEAAACNVPFVATSTPATQWMTEGLTASLYQPGDLDGLTSVVLHQLSARDPGSVTASSWRTIARNLERLLRRPSPRTT
jgi:glycosyltransferase involved in cell wall biosynthesis